MNAKTKAVTIKGALYFNTNHWNEESKYQFFDYPTTLDGQVKICDHEFTLEVPADFDPRPQQIKALEAQRQELHNKFAAAVLEIDQRINSLLALEMS